MKNHQPAPEIMSGLFGGTRISRRTGGVKPNPSFCYPPRHASMMLLSACRDMQSGVFLMGYATLHPSCEESIGIGPRIPQYRRPNDRRYDRAREDRYFDGGEIRFKLKGLARYEK
ncbi:hypothetical protein SAMN05216402_2255 [Nitrosospira multiformis]|uniref:Uncharacterized protein n=1 Tax=Nitrosospira multiformis TaxID=1231 RepID=A0ABY0TG48_9PROT|nr:hypothetical protein SAMN05216402_2255 [Nitrosospira multiformis]